MLAGMLLALMAGLWVVQPILARRAALLVDATPGEARDAEHRKRVALASLQEVEYDYLAGKLDEDDYRALRRQLRREALSALDRSEGFTAAPDGGESVGKQRCCDFVNRPGSTFCGGCGARVQ